MSVEVLWRRGLKAAPFVGGLVVAFLVPLLNSDTVFVNQITVVALYAVALMGLNVAMGYAGLQNLATGAVFGIGAIASAGLADTGITRLRVDGRLSGTAVPAETVGHFLLSIAGGAAIAAVLGLLLLLPALRLGRSATTMVSLYMAVASPIFVGLERLQSYTGGTIGFKTSASSSCSPTSTATPWPRCSRSTGSCSPSPRWCSCWCAGWCARTGAAPSSRCATTR